MTGGAGLAGNPPPSTQHQDVEFVSRLRGQQRLANGGAGGFGREIVLERPSVNREIPFAGAKNTRATDSLRRPVPRY